ncbi:MAG: ATP-binding cassette domain-containing protein [Eggerthellaceae bacterium]|nr:ATP-binding cassette domain-containing protein [Eggerthellaceae bacterium]
MSLIIDIKKEFKGFTLETAFEAGNETIGLLGESGCGKSLTMRSIAGIETPDEGKIIVNDEVYFDRVRGQRPKVNLTPQQRKTALLFQNYMLFPNLKVGENVAAGIPKDVTAAERDAIVAAELKRFSLEHFIDRYPVQLSGGQQQRVALARMLAAKPGILMLDEPFSALDAHLKSALEQNCVTLFEAFHGTVLYVSHDIDEALRFCDRIAVIDNGHIMEIDEGDELVNTPKSKAAIKLSGCKNITDAEYVDEHTVFLPDWGVDVHAPHVPKDVKTFGIRATFIERVDGPGENCCHMVVDRASDARFERTLLLRFLDGAALEVADENGVIDEMRFLHTHVFWRIPKNPGEGVPLAPPPEAGDELWVRFPASKIYLVDR